MSNIQIWMAVFGVAVCLVIAITHLLCSEGFLRFGLRAALVLREGEEDRIVEHWKAEKREREIK